MVFMPSSSSHWMERQMGPWQQQQQQQQQPAAAPAGSSSSSSEIKQDDYGQVHTAYTQRPGDAVHTTRHHFCFIRLPKLRPHINQPRPHPSQHHIHTTQQAPPSPP
jgi:hypothetical protein